MAPRTSSRNERFRGRLSVIRGNMCSSSYGGGRTEISATSGVVRDPTAQREKLPAGGATDLAGRPLALRARVAKRAGPGGRTPAAARRVRQPPDARRGGAPPLGALRETWEPSAGTG